LSDGRTQTSQGQPIRQPVGQPSLFYAVPEGEPLNVWIEPWGISITSADADWLAGWIAMTPVKA
jgi:hypothetical protein